MNDNSVPSLNPADFRKLMLAEFDAVYRLARHLAGERADDAVQETYYLALRAEDRFQLRERGVRPWLFRILNNVIRTQRRDGRFETPTDDLDQFEMPASQPRVTPNAKLTELNWDDVESELKHAVLSLTPELRAVFLLFAVEDLKYREIAEVLEIPLGTVMSRLNRARHLMVGKLASEQAKLNKTAD